MKVLQIKVRRLKLFETSGGMCNSLYWVPFGQPSKIGSLELLYHVKGDWFLTMFLTTHKPTNKHTYQNQLQNNDFAKCKLLPGKRAMKICVDSFF